LRFDVGGLPPEGRAHSRQRALPPTRRSRRSDHDRTLLADHDRALLADGRIRYGANAVRAGGRAATARTYDATARTAQRKVRQADSRKCPGRRDARGPRDTVDDGIASVDHGAAITAGRGHLKRLAAPGVRVARAEVEITRKGRATRISDHPGHHRRRPRTHAIAARGPRSTDGRRPGAARGSFRRSRRAHSRGPASLRTHCPRHTG